MEQNSTTETQSAGHYKVISVLLLESTFKRETGINSAVINDIENEINITPTAHETTPDRKFAVTLSVHYKGTQNLEQICEAEIKMIGVFEKIDEPVWPEEKFKAINGPAIIYPFIREHLHNLCLKAGIANVLLPTVNFKP